MAKEKLKIKLDPNFLQVTNGLSMVEAILRYSRLIDVKHVITWPGLSLCRFLYLLGAGVLGQCKVALGPGLFQF